MKLKQTLVAAATGATLCIATATTSATNLGEVWSADQANGILHIFKQSELNDPGTDAMQQKVDLGAATTAKGQSLNNTKMHISGFTNHSGLSSKSRAVLAYLGGQMQIWKTNGGPAAPELISTHDVSVDDDGSGPRVTSLHMCGPSPDNSLIGCSSIGNKEIVLFSMDVDTDTYTKIGNFPLSGLQIHPKVKGVKLAAVLAAIAKGALNGSAVCNNFDTKSNLLYVTTNIGGTMGGVLVLDVRKPNKPRIRDAVFGGKADGLGYGCGLLNSKNGKFMFTNVGNQTDQDFEGVLKWRHADAYDNSRSGPRKSVEMTQKTDSYPDVPGKAGDAHGAQLAGLGGGFIWEVQRVDDVIQVVTATGKLQVVNSIDMETASNPNPAPDVIDRSALGTRMYVSSRSAVPITAIGSLKDTRRTPGVFVLGTVFGYNGVVLKHEDMNSGIPGNLDGVPYDTSDPHGLKSLSYITGGF